MTYIVLVCGDNQLAGQLATGHSVGEETGKDVTKVSTWNNNARARSLVVLGRLEKREVGVEVVGLLGENTGPVNSFAVC